MKAYLNLYIVQAAVSLDTVFFAAGFCLRKIKNNYGREDGFWPSFAPFGMIN